MPSLPLSALLTRRWICCSLPAILGFLAVAASTAADQPLRVMSFNIRYGAAKDGDNDWSHRRNLVVQTVQAFNPDLLGTQETLNYQREYLADHLRGYTAFGVGRDDGKDAGEQTALFFRANRFDLLDSGHFWLSETPDVPGSKSWDTALTRMASWVKLRDRQASADGKGDVPALWYLNTHFDHKGPQAREEAAKLLRRWAAERPARDRIILTGDFNAAEGSAPYQALLGPAPERANEPVVKDSYRVLHPRREEEEGTFNGFKPDSRKGGRIDWIAVSPGFNVREAGIVRTAYNGRTPSDHFPVTAVLE